MGDQLGEKVKKYLGALIIENNNYTTKIKTRIERAHSNFMTMKKTLCSKDLTLVLKIRFTKCYVCSVLVYGMES